MKKILIALAALALTFAAFTYLNSDKESPPIPALKTLSIGETVINVEIVDTESLRMQGLSGRTHLDQNTGMLFIFEKAGDHGFWMKDMNFAIDIAWLDENKKIAHIESEVAPETYPKIFRSPGPSLYVLEVPSGFLAENNVQIGDQVAF